MRYLRMMLVPLVFVACSERQLAAPDIEEAPNFGATVTNDIVYWPLWRGTWMDNDASQGEPWDVLLLGYDPADDPVCNDGVLMGGTPVRRHFVVSKEGFPDEFSQRDLRVVTTIGRPPLYLYMWASLPAGGTPDELCDFFKNGWIAAGHWSAVISVDNDLSGGDGTPGMNTWGGTEAGILWGDDGSMYKYSWKYRLLWEPERGFDKVANSVDMVEQIK